MSSHSFHFVKKISIQQVRVGKDCWVTITIPSTTEGCPARHDVTFFSPTETAVEVEILPPEVKE
jgi:hypothetical protein